MTIVSSRKVGVTILPVAVDAIASRWGTTVENHEVLVDHRSRAVMRSVDPQGRPVVIKADLDTERLRREAKALAAAGQAGVPVPAVLEHVDASPAILVLAYVEGQPLNTSNRSQHWWEVGRQLRRLHDDASPHGLPMFGGGQTWWATLRSLADWSRNWCRERRVLDPAVLDRLAALMDAAFARDDEPAGCFLHGDCGPYHWLLRDGAVAAVVDFGDAGRGDPAWDLAVLTLWDGDRLPVILDGYGADRVMRDHVKSLLMPYTVIRHLLAISWLVEHDFDPSPTITELHRLVVPL